jgi:uncharacterized protein YdhG (YjbR/CyaY superfamily)
MQSKAKNVDAYITEAPEDRKPALTRLRALIRQVAPDAVESMGYGMPTYAVGEMLFAFASQKGYLALYVCETAVVEKHRGRLGKLDCGKSCIRFKKPDQIPWDVISDILQEAHQKRKTAGA